MRVFQAVVSEGGFASAARKLDISPAVVTRLVDDLEQHLGTRLLQRTTRKHALTDAGQDYLSRVRHILSDIDEAEAFLNDHNRELGGMVRIRAQPVIATHVLAPLILEFRERYPQVTLDIYTTGSEMTIEDYDITILGARADFDANVIARPIVQSQGVICASAGYLERAGMPRTPEDLSRHACLRLRVQGNRPKLWNLINPDENDREIDVEVDPVLVADHSDTLLRATVDGAGISGHPLDLVGPYLATGQLKRVLAPWITGRFTLYAAMPSRKFVPVRTRIFLEFLIDQTRKYASDADRPPPALT